VATLPTASAITERVTAIVVASFALHDTAGEPDMITGESRAVTNPADLLEPEAAIAVVAVAKPATHSPEDRSSAFPGQSADSHAATLLSSDGMIKSLKPAPVTPSLFLGAPAFGGVVDDKENYTITIILSLSPNTVTVNTLHGAHNFSLKFKVRECHYPTHLNRQPSTDTLHSTLNILHLAQPHILHPTTYTLHTTIHTLHPSPNIIHPTPIAPHPTFFNLNLLSLSFINATPFNL
jgi:hypothetical protein